MLGCLCCCAVCELGVCILSASSRWVEKAKLRTGVDVHFMRSLTCITSVQRGQVLGEWAAHGGK